MVICDGAMRLQLRLLDRLRREVQARPEIEVLTDSVVTGRYDGNWVAIVQRNLPGVLERLIKARVKALIVAPGLIERPYVFEGNDLPGVMLSGAVRRLINLYAVRPGSRAVVFTANDEGDRAVADLGRANVEVAAIVDARRGDGIVRAYGRGEVRGVELANGARVGCDLLVVAAGWTAPGLLLNMAGDRPRYEAAAARFFPGGRLSDDVFAAGGLAGDGSIEELIGHAQAVGQAAAARAGHGNRARDPAARDPQSPCAVPQPYSRNSRLVRGRVFRRPMLRRQGRLRLDRVGQAVHHFNDGPDPGKAGDHQHDGDRGRDAGAIDRGNRNDSLAASIRANHARRFGRAADGTEARLADAAVA